MIINKQKLIAITFSLFIVGCNESTTQMVNKAEVVEKKEINQPLQPKVDLQSPDNAVKSWWRTIDAYTDSYHQLCLKGQKESDAVYKKNVELFKRVWSEELQNTLDENSKPCTFDVYGREITLVKTESDTRALVFATVKNISPIPPGADAGQNLAEWRSKGEKFKYLVEKSSDGWRVAQVYKFNENSEILKEEEYMPVYEKESKSSYPWHVEKQ